MERYVIELSGGFALGIRRYLNKRFSIPIKDIRQSDVANLFLGIAFADIESKLKYTFGRDLDWHYTIYPLTKRDAIYRKQ